MKALNLNQGYQRMLLDNHSNMIVQSILAKQDINYGQIASARMNYCANLTFENYIKALRIHKVVKYLIIGADITIIKDYIERLLCSLDNDEMELLLYILEYWKDSRILKIATIISIEKFKNKEIDFLTYKNSFIDRDGNYENT